MNTTIDDGISEISKRSPSRHRFVAHSLLLTATLLLIVGLAALWSASSQPAFAETPSHVVSGGSQNGKGPDAPECDPNWTVVTSSNVGSNVNNLVGVSAVSANDVWAVGDYNNGSASRTLIERWNGTGWNAVPSPNVGAGDNRLSAVDVVSANDVWAVGSFKSGSTSRTFIMRWNGSTWSGVVSPNANANDNFLLAVDAVSANDVWAVGYYEYTADTVLRTLAMHWDGNVWAQVSIPYVGSTFSTLRSIAAISANDVWAVGYYEYTEGIFRTLTMHWNGIAWSMATSPNVGATYNFLVGVTAITANNVWAVGWYQNGTNPTRTLTLQWNGSTWNAVTSPNVGTGHNFLNSVAAVSANDIWAVGVYSTGPSSTKTLVERWTGSSWSVVSSPNMGTDPSLFGVTAVSASDVWAVGYYTEFPAVVTLIERYNPCVASPTPTTPISQATSTPTNTPGGPSTATPTSCPIQFTDVPPGSTFYEFVRCMACQGIINGYTSGCETGNPCFRPNNNVSRGQLSKIVSNAAGFNEPVGAQQFEDVPSGSTFFDVIWRLANRGHVGGYACGGAGEPCVPPGNLPYFRPNGNASRGQISKIVSNAAGFSEPPGAQMFEDMPPSHTFHDFVQRLANRAVMGGYACGGAGEPCVPPGNLPYFRPASNATRGQTSKIVANAFFPDCNTPGR